MIKEILSQLRAFRWQKLLIIWAVFVAMAAILFAERSGIQYEAAKFKLNYLPRTEVEPAQTAMFGQPVTCLLLYDSGQEGTDNAKEQFDRILLDMKVSTQAVDVHTTSLEGIYTREREEEIIRAEWVVPSFKSRWIRFFYVLSEEIYRRAFRVRSLFYNARRTQIEMGCNAEKCIVIPNGVQYERFCNIPLKQEDGWVDIGAVVRLAPIKDVKTMIYAFFELASRVPNVRLHIMGGVDDEDYAKECYALVEELQLKNLIFTGRVDVVQYMQKLDFTILTSISEGQPLSVLESMAARRPCVTTEVGCCRELLEGAPGDTFGIAGYCVPPMYRQGLADAMEKMCASRTRREEMGRIGQRRVDAYFHHEQMLANYRKMYDETAKEYHLE